MSKHNPDTINTKEPTKPTSEKTQRKRKKKQGPHYTRGQIIGLVAAIVGFLLPFFIPFPGLEAPATYMFAIFLAAIALWVSEAIPLVATAVFVILAEVLLISDEALITLPQGYEPEKYAVFFQTLAHPVVILFLGGFMLADGAAKFGADKALAAVMLKPFQKSARITVLGIMAITALLSMFMSNTATTATMLAVLAPVLFTLPPGKSRTGLALSVPVAANVGGIGTPVGTPPNAIALSAMSQKGINISFTQWMEAAVPLVIIVLVLAWFILSTMFIDKDVELTVDLNATFQAGRDAIIYYVTAALTIGLWLTEPLHGIPSYIVGFVLVVVVLCTQVMGGNDLKALDWPVLWLVGGGIALGKGVGVSGLDTWLVNLIPWDSLPFWLLLVALGAVALGLSTVISNSATANLLIPLGLGLVASQSGEHIIHTALVLAIACSLAMCLPISTPPNAIAYSTGEITTKNMAIVGAIVGIAGLAIVSFVMPLMWTAMGVGT